MQQNAPDPLVSQRTERDRSRPWRIAGLLLLCGIGAELLAAYSDTTGDPAAIAFVLVFFGALYGAPALLARDLARRLGWGWPSMLLIFAALGTVEACLIDQSLFSANYQGFEGWEETREATLVPALGLSVFNAYNFIIGHMIFSFGAPVAIAESWSPRRAREPWLGRLGTAISVLAYAGAALLVLQDPESHSANGVQLAGSAAAIAALIAAAILIGRRFAGRSSSPARSGETVNLPFSGRARNSEPLWLTFIVALILAFVAAFPEETWIGFAVGTVTIAVTGLWVWWASSARNWSVRNMAAVALAFLVVRGALAFTYFPLLGEVAPGPKYIHNVLMLALVGIAGLFAMWHNIGEQMPD
jgi:hypothetical protein